MKYTTPATSATQALIIYLLDVSGSMEEQLDNSTKIEVVTEALRKTIIRMVQRSTKGTTIVPRYKVAMLTYSTYVKDILGGIKTIKEVANIGIPDLVALETTDTASAFLEAEKLITHELPNLQNSPAPLICHMTDGLWNGPSDPTPIVDRIKSISVPDGNVLVENIFVSNKILSSQITEAKEWEGLLDESQLTDDYAKSLYKMSSEVPESYRIVINEMGYKIKTGARMMFPGSDSKMVELGFAMSGATPITKVQVPQV
ncbi:MAG: VWA domain-containing protein [Anaerolineales bacterium]|nr:VWA domain-containing protein [Anaerolineales bacterium]